MSRHPIQYTVRGVPGEVDRALRNRARTQKKSVNQVIIDELTMATIGRRKIADFSDLVGRWAQDEEFDAILAGQRAIGPEDWR